MSKDFFWRKPKWQHKYLALARTLADNNDACLSRKVGCVLVSEDNTIISLGYNGAFRGCPHPNTKEYWVELNKLLDDDLRATLLKGIIGRFEQLSYTNVMMLCPLAMSWLHENLKYDSLTRKTNIYKSLISNKYYIYDNKTDTYLGINGPLSIFDEIAQLVSFCPRRSLGFKSGEGRQFCFSCLCSEVNALYNANRSGVSTKGAICFVTTHPCYNCALALVQAGIQAIVYQKVKENPYIDKYSENILRIARMEVIGV